MTHMRTRKSKTSPSNTGTYTICVTVFIRINARGAYLVFGLLGGALILEGRLFERGRLLNFQHFSRKDIQNLLVSFTTQQSAT